jgi:hypothetical protein
MRDLGRVTRGARPGRVPMAGRRSTSCSLILAAAAILVTHGCSSPDTSATDAMTCGNTAPTSSPHPVVATFLRRLRLDSRRHHHPRDCGRSPLRLIANRRSRIEALRRRACFRGQAADRVRQLVALGLPVWMGETPASGRRRRRFGRPVRHRPKSSARATMRIDTRHQIEPTTRVSRSSRAASTPARHSSALNARRPPPRPSAVLAARLDDEGGVVLHEVAVMAIAGAERAPAAVITWARESTALPAPRTPGTLVRPVRSTIAKPTASSSQPSR